MVDSDAQHYSKNDICKVCSSQESRKLGVRGNREYSGADKKSFPHLRTNVVKCKHCGFIFCNPTIKQSSALELKHYGDSEVYRASSHNEDSLAFVAGIGIIQKYRTNGDLMDIGAGKGEFISFANKNGYCASGLEPSIDLGRYAKENYGADIFLGGLSDFVSVKSRKYDVVTLFHVLEHIEDPKLFIQNLKKILKQEGVAYIEVPNGDATLLRIADLFFKIIRRNWSARLSPLHPPFHSVAYTKKSLRYLFNANGYNVLEIGTLSGSKRGHQVRGRFNSVVHLLRHLIVKVIGLFPNKELLFVVVSVE